MRKLLEGELLSDQFKPSGPLLVELADNVVVLKLRKSTCGIHDEPLFLHDIQEVRHRSQLDTTLKKKRYLICMKRRSLSDGQKNR